MRHSAVWIVLIAAAVVQGGCYERARNRAVLHFEPQHAITNWSRDARFERLGIRRVAVMPFIDRGRYAAASAQLTEAFVSELRKVRQFDVTVCPAGAPLAQLTASRGSFDAVQARLLGETFNVEAVIIGEIDEYRPYRPLAIGLRVVMIDTRSGRIVWTVDETLDTDELAVANLARAYYYEVIDPEASEYKADRVLRSMATFARCVCYHFIRTLDRPLTAEPPPVSAGASGAAAGAP
jgi:TolB-like protein